MKSAGKRSTFRFTALFRLDVVTPARTSGWEAGGGSPGGRMTWVPGPARAGRVANLQPAIVPRPAGPDDALAAWQDRHASVPIRKRVYRAWADRLLRARLSYKVPSRDRVPSGRGAVGKGISDSHHLPASSLFIVESCRSLAGNSWERCFAPMFTGARLESETGSNFWTFALFGSGYASVGSSHEAAVPQGGAAAKAALRIYML